MASARATDTEVIIYAYEQWGTGCLARLRGMFAFGIWDRRRRRIFLARDRVGKKPLFTRNSAAIFSSPRKCKGYWPTNAFRAKSIRGRLTPI